jgi:hypothetical protein
MEQTIFFDRLPADLRKKRQLRSARLKERRTG